ncbi:hypothetical protein PUN28_004922 [Cardiocondyla obscurior]|uniref:Uncharacterized protein n=1 Tax=Cardiocondyla obscurior TaxID=286306 RepID=A0AAW2GEZ8_9HYME
MVEKKEENGRKSGKRNNPDRPIGSNRGERNAAKKISEKLAEKRERSRRKRRKHGCVDRKRKKTDKDGRADTARLSKNKRPRGKIKGRQIWLVTRKRDILLPNEEE